MTEEQKTKKPRGFAAMTAEQRKEIASKGGRAAHEQGTAYEFNSERARHAAKIGAEKRKKKSEGES